MAETHPGGGGALKGGWVGRVGGWEVISNLKDLNTEC